MRTLARTWSRPPWKRIRSIPPNTSGWYSYSFVTRMSSADVAGTCRQVADRGPDELVLAVPVVGSPVVGVVVGSPVVPVVAGSSVVLVPSAGQLARPSAVARAEARGACRPLAPRQVHRISQRPGRFSSASTCLLPHRAPARIRTRPCGAARMDLCVSIVDGAGCHDTTYRGHRRMRDALTDPRTARARPVALASGPRRDRNLLLGTGERPPNNTPPAIHSPTTIGGYRRFPKKVG
jgi:hypothetical protein